MDRTLADKYAFHWRAEFTDGSVLKQFEDDGTPHSFAEVQDREDDLVYFWLELQDTPSPLNIGVSLVDGKFNVNEFEIESLHDDSYPWVRHNPKFRVINFRRVRQHFNEQMYETTRDTDYFIGWQITHEGKNYKKLLKIGADGTFGMS